jgi:RNA polymerase sigma-70 factor (ECF subfamily)
MQSPGIAATAVATDLAESTVVVRRGAVVGLADLETLVRLYRARVFRFLMMSVRDADVADTLTQDCFLKVDRARDRFRGECSAETWLMRVAMNLLRDHARNRKLQFWRRASATSVDVADVVERISNGQSSPEAAVIAKEQMELVWRAAEELPPRQREVFLLRFLEDRSVDEIAAITGTAEKTVKSNLYRALSWMRANGGGMK